MGDTCCGCDYAHEWMQSWCSRDMRVEVDIIMVPVYEHANDIENRDDMAMRMQQRIDMGQEF